MVTWFLVYYARGSFVIRPKSVTLAFDHLVGEDGFVWCLSVTFEWLRRVWVCFSGALHPWGLLLLALKFLLMSPFALLGFVITGLSIRIERHCPRLQSLFGEAEFDEVTISDFWF
jgi:hypothetical protein